MPRVPERPGPHAGAVVPAGQPGQAGASSTEHRPSDNGDHPAGTDRRDRAGVPRREDSIELHIGSGGELSEAERRIVEKLRARDQAVRARAEAQRAAAGQIYRGGPVYQYTTGPDGKQYAVDAQVQIESGEGRSPAETIERAQLAARTALAGPEPTDADRRAAARAQLMAAEAQRAKALPPTEEAVDADRPERRVDLRG